MKKILIVDDNFQMRRLLSIAFDHDYHVLQAADGTTALNMVRQHRPDVVILDGMMPGLDGLTVLEAIKSEPTLAHTLVAMITGRGQFSDLERGMDLGADAYFIKPFSPLKVRAWVQEHLQLRDNPGPPGHEGGNDGVVTALPALKPA